MTLPDLGALFLALLSCSSAPGSPSPLPLHVSGNRLVDRLGRPVRLRGVNIAGLEWSNTGDGDMAKSVAVAMDEWKANCIRLPVCQDRWFGKAPGQSDGGADYRERVDALIRSVAQRGGYVVLDLHWSDAGEWGAHIAQHKMPDPNSLAFWKDAAAKYAGNPCVLFGLYNEPHDVSWEVWRLGGEVLEKDDKQHTELRYTAPGMQALVDAVRSTGARNVCVVGGLDWAYDLRGVLNGHALKDPGGAGIVYDAHIYPWKSDWDGNVGRIAERVPVLVGEVGCNAADARTDPAEWAPKVLAYIDQHALSFTAWCFHPSASPCILKDWSYTPTAYWGVYVKRALSEGR